MPSSFNDVYNSYRTTSLGVAIHTEDDYHKMRMAGKLAKQTLDYIEDFVQEGVSTGRLNDLCHEFIIAHNATPAPLGYKGFPKSVCTSVNHVVCHGIPSEEQVLRKGDSINIDVTVILEGYHGDTSRMFFAGEPSIMAKRLSDVTYTSMMKGIEKAKPGNTLRDIGIAIASHVESFGYSTVKDFCGHGVGRVFHMEPQVLHYNDEALAYQDMKIEPGMFFTIEPMVNVGSARTIISKHDGWTAYTRDKKLSAQYEHSIGITETGNEIFTA